MTNNNHYSTIVIIETLKTAPNHSEAHDTRTFLVFRVNKRGSLSIWKKKKFEKNKFIWHDKHYHLEADRGKWQWDI